MIEWTTIELTEQTPPQALADSSGFSISPSLLQEIYGWGSTWRGAILTPEGWARQGLPYTADVGLLPAPKGGFSPTALDSVLREGEFGLARLHELLAWIVYHERRLVRADVVHPTLNTDGRFCDALFAQVVSFENESVRLARNCLRIHSAIAVVRDRQTKLAVTDYVTG